VELTRENSKLKDNNDAMRELQDIKVRHQAALEILGEKTELVEELKQDILDMKEAYKTQIQDLVAKINSLTK
jgi:hypothetical protein